MKNGVLLQIWKQFRERVDVTLGAPVPDNEAELPKELYATFNAEGLPSVKVTLTIQELE